MAANRDAQRLRRLAMAADSIRIRHLLDDESDAPANAELREDGGYELREDGGYELRE